MKLKEMTPEQKREYARTKAKERHLRRIQDPEILAQYKLKLKQMYEQKLKDPAFKENRNAYHREYQGKRRKDPEYREQKNEYFREWRKKHPEYVQYNRKAYYKNKVDPKGYLRRLHYSLKQRCLGHIKHAQQYKGMEYLPIDQFLEFGLNSEIFLKMHQEYINSGWDRKLGPTVDRIDPNKGYTVDNIQFLTLSDNCSKGGFKPKTRKSKTKNK
jgi:hypothetical protein